MSARSIIAFALMSARENARRKHADDRSRDERQERRSSPIAFHWPWSRLSGPRSAEIITRSGAARRRGRNRTDRADAASWMRIATHSISRVTRGAVRSEDQGFRRRSADSILQHQRLAPVGSVRARTQGKVRHQRCPHGFTIVLHRAKASLRPPGDESHRSPCARRLNSVADGLTTSRKHPRRS